MQSETQRVLGLSFVESLASAEAEAIQFSAPPGQQDWPSNTMCCTTVKGTLTTKLEHPLLHVLICCSTQHPEGHKCHACGCGCAVLSSSSATVRIWQRCQDVDPSLCSATLDTVQPWGSPQVGPRRRNLSCPHNVAVAWAVGLS